MTTPFLTPMTPSSPAPLLINYSSYDHIDPNPNSSTAQDQHLPPFSLHHFPSPFLDDNQLFLNHLMADDDHVCAPDESNHDETNNMGQTSTVATEHDHPTSSSKIARKKTMINKGATSKQQRRSGKKDRHSKIYTAQGLRDRRMRLSLQIARKFFDLQDMLGFDKASKTIDWLFSKSKKAIKQLSCTTTNHLQVPQINMITGAKSESSMSSSECEEESDDEIKKVITASEGESRQTVKSRTSAYSNPIVRESRDRARARARERTREKRMIRCLEKSKPYLSDQTSTSYILAQLGSAASNPNSIFEIKGQGISMSCPSQERANSPRECSSIIQSSSLHQEMVNLGIIEKFLGAYASSSSSSSCSIFDYQKNDTLFSSGLYSYPNKFLGFPEYWDNINSNNSAMTTSMVPTLTGKTPTSGFMANYNYQHFQSHNQAD